MAIPMKQDEKRFKIQQLEKELNVAARMARSYPYDGKWQRKLTRIQNKLAQLRSK